jgi:putative tryptophan/tyrosine transport system substrate-binding protein
VAKQLELLRKLVPTATRVALLANPANATVTESTLRDVQPAARAMGLQTEVFNADSSREINAAFASFMRDRPDALFIDPGPFFVGRRVQLTQLAALHRMPAIYPVRQFVEAGGLMSYGASLMEAFRQVGVYTGRVLKGTKPSDLPVAQSTKFELVINAQTALMVGLEVPATLLSQADEVSASRWCSHGISACRTRTTIPAWLAHWSVSLRRSGIEHSIGHSIRAAADRAGLPSR